MQYSPRFFNPPVFGGAPQPVAPATPAAAERKPTGDRRDGLGYVYTPDIVLKVNIALATGRPLLISGPSGCGKSSLATNIARYKRWRYYEFVVTSRTRARDLLWTFDTLRRLSDAEQGRLRQADTQAATAQQTIAERANYIEPGALWWALDPASAARRGLPEPSPHVLPARDTNKNDEANEPQAVVLIDEIDKADPDVPNDLLVPLGSHEFRVDEIETDIRPLKTNPAAPIPLILITTNGERELPKAFLRRCLVLPIGFPKEPTAKRDFLIQIAKRRFGDAAPDVALYTALADLMDVRPPNTASAPLPSIAEFIDALHACFEFGVQPNRADANWCTIEAATLWKPRDPTRG